MFFLPQYSLNCQRSYFTLEVPKTRNKLRATRTPDFEWVTWACSFQAVCKKFKNNNNKNTLRTFCFRKFLSYIQKWHFLWINRNFLFYNYRKKPQTVVPTHFFHLLRQHVLIMWKKKRDMLSKFHYFLTERVRVRSVVRQLKIKVRCMWKMTLTSLMYTCWCTRE